MNRLIPLSIFLCTATFQLAFAQTKSSDNPPKPPASEQVTSPDNTKVNRRDKNGASDTAQTQSNAADDRKLLAEVRRAVTKDKSLSTTAHNAKILVSDGTVTLRGPVRTEKEKSRVESIAKQVDGVTAVENMLDVKSR